MTRPDVLIVGGGVIGCAVAYELAKEGLRVTLLERTGLCAGAWGANGALIWPQAMHREYRRTGGMVAIETDAQWAQMAEYVAGQPAMGLHAELLDGAEARSNTRTLRNLFLHESTRPHRASGPPTRQAGVEPDRLALLAGPPCGGDRSRGA